MSTYFLKFSVMFTIFTQKIEFLLIFPFYIYFDLVLYSLIVWLIHQFPNFDSTVPICHIIPPFYLLWPFSSIFITLPSFRLFFISFSPTLSFFIIYFTFFLIYFDLFHQNSSLFLHHTHFSLFSDVSVKDLI